MNSIATASRSRQYYARHWRPYQPRNGCFAISLRRIVNLFKADMALEGGAGPPGGTGPSPGSFSC